MGVVGAALRGFGKALRKHRIKHGERGKTITSVKPMSGKVPLVILVQEEKILVKELK